jgi:argininosuccinate lyase
MGAAAGFGTSFPIDRAMVGKALGFSRVQENSIDAVTNRGEHEAVVAFAYAQAMNHLSGLAETLIIFSMPQVGFVKLDARYSTGSSMMPQKRNPDALEITKAKAALAQSCLFGMLSLGRGAFTGYNRDSQYAKKFLVDCIGECALAPQVLAGIVETLAVDAEKMAEESKKYGIGSTFEAERLATEKKMPFRQAKKLVEERVKASQGRP